MAIIIKHACVVNEGQRGSQDIKIVGKRIVQIATDITAKVNDQVIDANGLLLLPGMIDDQVHFRVSLALQPVPLWAAKCSVFQVTTRKLLAFAKLLFTADSSSNAKLVKCECLIIFIYDYYLRIMLWYVIL